MTALHANVATLTAVSGQLQPSGLAGPVGATQAPSLGHAGADAALNLFTERWSRHLAELDAKVGAASRLIGVYAGNFVQADS